MTRYRDAIADRLAQPRDPQPTVLTREQWTAEVHAAVPDEPAESPRETLRHRLGLRGES